MKRGQEQEDQIWAQEEGKHKTWGTQVWQKHYDKMHYEEELDLFCRCIRANISIMLHKTIYEINSTPLLRTHFKPPSSVCNNFLLRSHVEFGRLRLLKYAIIAFYIAAQISISDVHIHLKKITHKPYPIVIVCLLSYIIYNGCCHVYFCCVKALTRMLWLKLTLFVMLQPPLHS